MDPKSLKQIEQVLNKSLVAQEKRLERKFVTKDDLSKELQVVKNDLKLVKSTMVTKDDLPHFRKEITEDISEVVKQVIESIDERKADKTHVNLIGARVTQIERKLAE